MACPDTNPCGCSDDCLDTNPCYDNCGCLNPTTFECITKPGSAYTCMGVTTDMNGAQVLGAINAKFCDLIEQIENIEVGEPVEGSDINVKISSNDTTTGYLTDKITVDSTINKALVSPLGNEKLRLSVDIPNIISGDTGNKIVQGSDGKLKVVTTDTTLVLAPGAGISIDGDGTASSPKIISLANSSIQAARSCFSGTWNNITLGPTGNTDVVFIAGQPKYRIRFDGSIEFKGSITYTVNFGAYSTSNRKHTITAGAISTSCVTATEQAATADLKNISYIDIPQASADQMTQQYAYIIRKANQNIVIEFQSAFSNATSKTIVVNFDGAISHPNI